jgi:hypothetical protein
MEEEKAKMGGLVLLLDGGRRPLRLLRPIPSGESSGLDLYALMMKTAAKKKKKKKKAEKGFRAMTTAKT